jgi:hypothetical protein
MSGNINFILRLFRNVFFKDTRYLAYNKGELYYSISCFSALYAFSSQKTEEISISKKYTMVRGGFTEFMVVDSQGRHFNVNNSLWYWKWDSLEDYYKIKKGDKVKVGYYGWRWPLFGMFPNIVRYF